MAIPIAAVGAKVVDHRLDMLDRAIPPAMVVAALCVQVVGVRIPAVAGQDVVEIKDRHIVVRVTGQPVVDQPSVQEPVSKRTLALIGKMW